MVETYTGSFQSEAGSKFDSFRIDDPNPINLNGQSGFTAPESIN